MNTAEVEFVCDDGTRLSGTLTIPDAGRGGRAVAALLLSGSGRLDRDSNMAGQALNVGNALASALAAHGVASLRYDKRGVGRSAGDYLRTGFDRETLDAAAALEALRRFDGIDGDRTSVVGHSVGATIAIRLASADRGIAGAVLLSVSMQTGADVMRWQSERIAGSLSGISRLFSRRFLRRQERVRRRVVDSSGDIVRTGRTRLPARWLREFMAYDPKTDLPSIRCPVLAITGRSDIQVDPEDVARLGELVAHEFSGSTPEGLSHLLRRHPGPPSLATYPAQLAHPVDPEVVDCVAVWTAARAPVEGPSSAGRREARADTGREPADLEDG